MFLNTMTWVCGVMMIVCGVAFIVWRNRVLVSKQRLESAGKTYPGPQSPAAMVGYGVAAIVAGLMMFAFDYVRGSAMPPGPVALAASLSVLVIGLKFSLSRVPGPDGPRLRPSWKNLWAYILVVAACTQTAVVIATPSLWGA